MLHRMAREEVTAITDQRGYVVTDQRAGDGVGSSDGGVVGGVSGAGGGSGGVSGGGVGVVGGGAVMTAAEA